MKPGGYLSIPTGYHKKIKLKTNVGILKSANKTKTWASWVSVLLFKNPLWAFIYTRLCNSTSKYTIGSFFLSNYRPWGPGSHSSQNGQNPRSKFAPWTKSRRNNQSETKHLLQWAFLFSKCLSFFSFFLFLFLFGCDTLWVPVRYHRNKK